MDGPMQVDVEQADGYAVVRLVGRLDIAGAEIVAMPLAVQSAAMPRGLLVDMSSVTFLASIGIRHLVMAAKSASRRGGRVMLVAPQPAVLEVLEVMGVTDLLAVVPSLDAARDMLAGTLG